MRNPWVLRAAGAVVLTGGVALGTAALATVQAAESERVSTEERLDAIRRADVWTPTDIETLDLWIGPDVAGRFEPNQLVECTYSDEKLGGKTPKFACTLPDGDTVKVKYGSANGEVFSEVAATRLLWALGFGADAMYPVRVRCTGCPPEAKKAEPETAPRSDANAAVRQYEFAAIERKMPGRELTDKEGPGWSWPELRLTAAANQLEERTHRDALTLLAVMLQHTDSKREQQRLICLDSKDEHAVSGQCVRPFMLINDVGLTFGKANAFNRNEPGSVDLDAWRKETVWADKRGCKTNLKASFTGTLDKPVISEGGRRFLASLLGRLSEAQIHDLFAVARFPSRQSKKIDGPPGRDVEEWVAAFRDKVAQITDRSCV